MLRYLNYNIVFQEVPDELTLAINITNCPNACIGCHSSHLQQDFGEILDENLIDLLLEKYGDAISCVCFMGGDADVQGVENLSIYIKKKTNEKIKTAWYTGKVTLPSEIDIQCFNYIKIGPYIESMGGLDAATSNQRYYRVANNVLVDETYRFQGKGLN